MVGSTLNMLLGIDMISLSSLLLSLALARHAYALETTTGFGFAVGFTLIGLPSVAMVVGASTGGVVGSESILSLGISTISSSSSSLGALVGCCGCYTAILTGSLRAGGAVPS